MPTTPIKVDPKARAFAEAARQVRVWAGAVRRAAAEVERATQLSAEARSAVFRALGTQQQAIENQRLAQQRYQELCDLWRGERPEIDAMKNEDEDDAE